MTTKHALSANERIGLVKRMFCDLILLSVERGVDSIETQAGLAISAAELLSMELSKRGYTQDVENEDDRI